MTQLTLDNSAIMEAVVAKIAENFIKSEGELYEEVERRIGKKIDALFVKAVEPRIEAEIEKALNDCFHREYQKRTPWGESDGEPTTIAKELEHLMTTFWSEKVDEKGKVCNYGKLTRADHTMAKVLGEDFRGQMERYLIQGAATLKDGLRATMRTQVDLMLGNLFHVQTAQDKAEGRYK